MTAGIAHRSRYRPTSVLYLSLALAVCAGALTAQTDAHKGRILGTVVDPTGAVVAGLKSAASAT